MAKKLIGHDPDQVPVNGFLGSVAYMDEPELAERIAFIESRKQQIAQSFVQKNAARGDLDVDLAVAIELGLLGAPVVGGFYAGLIDTTKGNIIAADAHQTGLRYALIVSDKILESDGVTDWDRSYHADVVSATLTRWNGLESTNAVIATGNTVFEAANYIANVRSQYPAVATPGGSEWYIPAMDELELLYRNFKPNNADNSTRSYYQSFPGTQVSGTNPSSYPNGIPYENAPRIPDVTFLDAFKEGNTQAMDQGRYWTSTENEGGVDRYIWVQNFTWPGLEGYQDINFTDSLDGNEATVRPVRRVVF